MALYINGQLQTMMPASSISNIRYVEADDMVQLYYDGQWRDWQSGGMAYPIGTELLFNYTGDVQKCTIPATGIWKMEVWGGQGKSASTSGNYGGKGGYSHGNANLQIGTILNIVVGDGNSADGTISSTGYNGGATGGQYTGYSGGATHIALEDSADEYSTLASYMSAQNATPYVFIVAGGGGSSGFTGSSFTIGGSGGGTTGGSGTNATYHGTAYGGGGGTQSGGGGGGSDSPDSGHQGTATGKAGSFGLGGGVNGGVYNGAGGGGWYGGGGGGYHFYNGQVGGSGGGGSGYVNTEKLIANTYAMENGTKEGRGLAKLTYLGRST